MTRESAGDGPNNKLISVCSFIIIFNVKTSRLPLQGTISADNFASLSLIFLSMMKIYVYLSRHDRVKLTTTCTRPCCSFGSFYFVFNNYVNLVRSNGNMYSRN